MIRAPLFDGSSLELLMMMQKLCLWLVPQDLWSRNSFTGSYNGRQMFLPKNSVDLPNW